MDVAATVAAAAQQIVTGLGRIGDELQGIREALNGRATAMDFPIIEIATIIAVAAEHYGVPEPDLRSPRAFQAAGPTPAQAMAMHLCRQLTDLSLVDVGQKFGYDPVVVLCEDKKIRAAGEQAGPVAAEIKTLTQRIVDLTPAPNLPAHPYGNATTSDAVAQ